MYNTLRKKHTELFILIVLSLNPGALANRPVSYLSTREFGAQSTPISKAGTNSADLTPSSDTPSSSDTKLWSNAGYLPQLSKNAVAALRPKDLPAYQAMSDSDKINYLKQTFPVIFRWDINESASRQILEWAEPSYVPAYLSAQSKDEQQQILFKVLGVDGVVLKLAPKIRHDTMRALGKSVDEKVGPSAEKRAFCNEMKNQLYRAVGLDVPEDTKKQLARAMAQYAMLQAPMPAIFESVISSAISLQYMQSLKQPTPKLKSTMKIVMTSAKGRIEPVSDEALAAQFQHGSPQEKARILSQSVQILMDSHIQPGPMAQFFALSDPEYGARVTGAWDPNVTPELWASKNEEERMLLVQHAFLLLRQQAEDVIDDQRGPQIIDELANHSNVPSNYNIISMFFGDNAEKVTGATHEQLYRYALSMWLNELLYGFVDPGA